MTIGFFLSAPIVFAATVPGAVNNVTAVAGDAKATISFTAGTNGGVAISKYIATSSPGNKTASVTTVSPITVAGLTNGTKYTFTVTATNSVGTGPASAKSNSITPTAATTATGTTATPAADTGTGVGVSIPNGTNDNAIQSGASYNYIQYVDRLYGFAMKAAIALSILMVVYAGFKYMTSRGDSSSINEAKDILVSTLMGAALLMLVILIGNIAGLNTSIWGI
ncbi:MAG: fibronectin type III domain-containing protein [Candidatus Berkelbacteria bacterium]|nr:fibronectin type III domain-containing protein [Candidatus Berkelbacteria bacterium]